MQEKTTATKERMTKGSPPLNFLKQATHNANTENAATILGEKIPTTRPTISNPTQMQRKDAAPGRGGTCDMRHLPRGNRARPGPGRRPGLPRGHRREHKGLGEFLLPRYPSKGFLIVNPLSLPFLTFRPLIVEARNIEFVEVIRGRRRVFRRHEPRDIATYSRCCFISSKRDGDTERMKWGLIDGWRAKQSPGDRVDTFHGVLAYR